MKVVLPKETGTPKEVPPLSLVPTEEDEWKNIDSTDFASYKVRVNPADADSPTATIKVPKIDGNQSIRGTLKWFVATERLREGLGTPTDNTGAPAYYRTLEQLLTGTAKTVFVESVRASQRKRHVLLQQAARDGYQPDAALSAQQNAAAAQALYDAVPRPDINNDDLGSAKLELIRAACPYKALEKQKRFMRRKMRKPNEMTTRTYVNHLSRINSEELIILPPGGVNQRLSDDEIMDIVIYGLPKSWVKEMDRQDFDPFTKTLIQTVEFCERMEASEDFPGPHKGKDSKSNKKSKTSPSNKSNKSSGGNHCEYHGPNTHPTSECKVIKAMVASAKKGDNEKPKYKNKTWKRSAEEGKKKTTKDLAAFIKKAVSKELNAVSAKRPAEDEGECSDDDASLNNVDLSKIDFSDLDVDDISV